MAHSFTGGRCFKRRAATRVHGEERTTPASLLVILEWPLTVTFASRTYMPPPSLSAVFPLKTEPPVMRIVAPYPAKSPPPNPPSPVHLQLEMTAPPSRVSPAPSPYTRMHPPASILLFDSCHPSRTATPSTSTLAPSPTTSSTRCAWLPLSSPRPLELVNATTVYRPTLIVASTRIGPNRSTSKTPAVWLKSKRPGPSPSSTSCQVDALNACGSGVYAQHSGEYVSPLVTPSTVTSDCSVQSSPSHTTHVTTSVGLFVMAYPNHHT
mmetsp:Transcript_68782/g.191905  ORF Transcript_68782/g.191905 Transcript_68782/m.191905 type:complete len:266 (-) Transcript_68782:136-933(-)